MKFFWIWSDDAFTSGLFLSLLFRLYFQLKTERFVLISNYWSSIVFLRHWVNYFRVGSFSKCYFLFPNVVDLLILIHWILVPKEPDLRMFIKLLLYNRGKILDWAGIRLCWNSLKCFLNLFQLFEAVKLFFQLPNTLNLNLI